MELPANGSPCALPMAFFSVTNLVDGGFCRLLPTPLLTPMVLSLACVFGAKMSSFVRFLHLDAINKSI
jgi:hypothetical protein